MTLRSAVWTGSNGAVWPALNNGDTWATPFWSSPTIDATQIAAGPTVAVDGSSRGSIAATHNQQPRLANGGGIFTTAASTAGRYTFAGSYIPSIASANINLVCVSTTWTASHYHSIVSASCTGGWANLTYDKVVDYVYNISGVYYCLSIFRTAATSSTSGSIVVDVYDTATSAIVATQATGGTCQVVWVSGVDKSSNGVNAIRTANTTTATNTTGQPTVTMTNAMLRYSSVPLMFCSHGTNDSSTSSSDSDILGSGSYGTPANGVAILDRVTPAAVANVKTTRTMTANFASSTSKWGAIGIEILDSNTTSDTYTDTTRDYTYVRVANSSVQPAYRSSEVRTDWTNSETAYGPYHGLVGRYVTSGGTKYWLGSSLRLDDVKGWGNAYIYAVVDNGTSTTVTTVAATTGSANSFASVNRQAMRVRVLSNGDLWVSAKFWISSNAEPAWPSNSGDASVVSGAPNSAVVNGVYSTNDLLRNSTTGQTGLFYLYPAGYGAVLSGGFSGPIDGAAELKWSAWSNSEWVVSDGTAAIAGGGSVAAAGTRVALGSASASGGGSLVATGTRIALGSASVSGNGTIAASGTHVAVGAAAFALDGAVVATGTRLIFGSATLDGGGVLDAIGDRIPPTSADVIFATLTFAAQNATGVSVATAAAEPAVLTLTSPAPKVNLVVFTEPATISTTSSDGSVALGALAVPTSSAALSFAGSTTTVALAPLAVSALANNLTFTALLGSTTATATALGDPPTIIFDAQLALVVLGILDVYGMQIGQPRTALKIQNPAGSHLAGDPRAFWRVRGVTRQ